MIRKKIVFSGKIQDRIDKKAAYFHLVAWSLPLILTITTMAFGEVDGSSVTGVCFVGYINHPMRAALLLAPLSVVLLLGGYFLLRGQLQIPVHWLLIQSPVLYATYRLSHLGRSWTFATIFVSVPSTTFVFRHTIGKVFFVAFILKIVTKLELLAQYKAVCVSTVILTKSVCCVRKHFLRMVNMFTKSKHVTCACFFLRNEVASRVS